MNLTFHQCKLSSAAILCTVGNQFSLSQRFTCTPIQNPGSRTTYAVLMSSKKSETAVYGCNPALLKFYQCRVDVLQSQIFLRSQIRLAGMFVITDFLLVVFLKCLRSYCRPSFLFNRAYCSRYLGRHEGA